MRGIRRKIGRVMGIATAVLAASAVVEQLRLPSSERTWHGKIAGVPYDFRRPSLDRFQKAWWNPENPSLFTARAYGVGWAVNLHRLLQLASSLRR